MNYVILYYIFMVHFCNIKMSADTMRHKANPGYDIDDFINRLLSSQKFDELADKVAEKAAKKIKGIDMLTPSRLERLSEGKKNETLQPNYREKAPNTEYGKETLIYKNSNFRNVEAMSQTGKLGKIDTVAVMKKEATSQSDRLKYKYLTRNAYEKKVFKERTPDNNEHNPVLRNNEKGDSLPNQNVKKEFVAVQARDIKVAGQASNQEAIEKKHTDAYKDSPGRYGNRDKEQRNYEKPHDTEGNRNQEGKMEHTREDNGPRRIPETEPSRPEFKSVSKSPESELEENIKEEEELNSSPEVEKKKPGALGNIESPIEKTEEAEDAKKSVEEQTGPMFRANDNDNSTEPDVEENKVTADNNTSSDDDIMTKPPIIRKEGDKIYTFMQGSDYEQYHEEFAKIKKENGDEDLGIVF